MQLLTGAPRDQLTADQVVALVEADSLTVDSGADLLDADDEFIDDLSADLEGGVVERGCYRTIHGTCQLRLARVLDWGSQRVRPWMSLTSAGVTARFDLGVYLLDTPSRSAGTTPAAFDVEGYDKLVVLNSPAGVTWTAPAGAGVLAEVRRAVLAAGETRLTLASEGDDRPLPAARSWPIDETNTWLVIVNELLASIGYRGLWVDEGGTYRSEPYVSPVEQAGEWGYDTLHLRTTVGEDRTLEADFFAVANRWVFIRQDPAGGQPVTADGIYTVDNVEDGPTSQVARGRVITRVVPLDAVDQAALVVQGDRVAEEDRRVTRRVTMTAGPNPLHGHFDVVDFADVELGLSERFLVTDWSLPLDGGDMSLDMKAVL